MEVFLDFKNYINKFRLFCLDFLIMTSSYCKRHNYVNLNVINYQLTHDHQA